MIELYINSLTKQIDGYNSTVNNLNNESKILVDDKYTNLLNSYFLSDKKGKVLYYIEGEIVEDDEQPVNEDQERLLILQQKANGIQKYIDNEYTTFIDNIIDGMSLEDARKISKDNREQLDSLNMEIDKLSKKVSNDAYNKLLRKFEEEESNMNYKYFLSMVTIVRNENDYIEEWIRYHIEEMGFDHFYIYDNESSIPVKDYLESISFKYLDKLTIIPWKTTERSQQDSHNDFLKNYGKETKWFIGTDPDEYIVIKIDSKTLIDFLNENSKYATILCLWKHFNANGQEHKTSGTDMERFTTETTWDDWKYGGKRFSQSNRVSHFRSYVPQAKQGLQILDHNNGMNRNYIQLNHYYTRSYDEFVAKIKRGSSNPNFRRRLSDVTVQTALQKIC